MMFEMFWKHIVSDLLWRIAWDGPISNRRFENWTTRLWIADQRRQVEFAEKLVRSSGWNGMNTKIGVIQWTERRGELGE